MLKVFCNFLPFFVLCRAYWHSRVSLKCLSFSAVLVICVIRRTEWHSPVSINGSVLLNFATEFPNQTMQFIGCFSILDP